MKPGDLILTVDEQGNATSWMRDENIHRFSITRLRKNFVEIKSDCVGCVVDLRKVWSIGLDKSTNAVTMWSTSGFHWPWENRNETMVTITFLCPRSAVECYEQLKKHF